MKLFREPLLPFLLLVVLIFGLYVTLARPGAQAAGPARIEITPEITQNLIANFERTAPRPPTPAEVDALIDDYVREEILDREARALGLDRDDLLVRRQLRQKMEVFLEDSASVTPATDAQLEDYLEKNAAALHFPAGNLPPLEQVRPAVSAAWEADQRRKIADTLYQALRSRYNIVIQKPPQATATPAVAPAPASATGAKP